MRNLPHKETGILVATPSGVLEGGGGGEGGGGVGARTGWPGVGVL